MLSAILFNGGTIYMSAMAFIFAESTSFMSILYLAAFAIWSNRFSVSDRLIVEALEPFAILLLLGSEVLKLIPVCKND